MKTAIIDVGGGLRGIYAAGVFDYLMDHHITFDIGYGISAGAANLSSYAAGQRGRNYEYFYNYSQRPEYMSLKNFVKGKGYIDLDYVYSTLSNTGGEYPLDYQALLDSPMDLTIVATNALNGKPAYFPKHFISENEYELLKATCSIPIAEHAIRIGNLPYYDGGVSDPIPLKKLLEKKPDKIVLLLTKPRDFVRDPADDAWAVRLLKYKYPAVASALANRAASYNEMLELARELEKEGRLLIVAPSDITGLSTLTRDQKRLDRLYQRGYADGTRIAEFLAKPLPQAK